MISDARDGIELVKANTCKICLLKESTYVMLPCSHLAYCLDCISTQTKCVICRKNVVSILQVIKS